MRSSKYLPEIKIGDPVEITNRVTSRTSIGILTKTFMDTLNNPAFTIQHMPPYTFKNPLKTSYHKQYFKVRKLTDNELIFLKL